MTCKSCGKDLSGGAYKCSHCGAAVIKSSFGARGGPAAPRGSAAPPKRPTPAPVKYCKHCGEEIDANAAFCNHCGASSKAQTAPRQSIAPNIPRPVSIAPPDDDDGPADYAKGAMAYINSSLRLLRKMLTNPATTIQSGSILLSNAVLFAVLQPLVQFILFRVIVGSIASEMGAELGMVPQINWLGWFFAFLGLHAGVLAAAVAVSGVLGKLFCKSLLSLGNIKTLASHSIMSQLPMTIAYLALLIMFPVIHITNSVLVLVIPALVLLFCMVASVTLYAFALSASLKTSFDKATIVSALTYTIVTVLVILVTISRIQAIFGNLTDMF